MFKKLSITAAAGLGLVMASAALSPAQAGWVEGSCSVFDATVDVAGEDVEATNCGNFSGNDSQVGFIDYLNGDKSWSGLSGYDAGDGDDAGFATAIDALDGDWSLFGKTDEGGDGVEDGGDGTQSGNFNFTEGLAGPFVVVQKASTYYSAYLFNNLEEAVNSGQFNVQGITAKSNGKSGFAGLSHISVYNMGPRDLVVTPPPTPKVPEPASLLGLAAFGIVSTKLKRNRQEA